MGTAAAVVAGAAALAIAPDALAQNGLRQYPAEIELQIRQGGQVGLKRLPVTVQQQLGPTADQGDRTTTPLRIVARSPDGSNPGRDGAQVVQFVGQGVLAADDRTDVAAMTFTVPPNGMDIGFLSETWPSLSGRARANQAAPPAFAAFAANPAPIVFGLTRVDNQVPNVPMSEDLLLRGRHNHYKCYRVTEGQRVAATVRLVDQFGGARVRSLEPSEVCTPVATVRRGAGFAVRDTRKHLVSYAVKRVPQRERSVSAQNQFGNQLLSTGALTHMLVPSLVKQTLGARRAQLPVGGRRSLRVSHFACYRASGPRAGGRSVLLTDRFERRLDRIARGSRINAICNPAAKTHGGSSFMRRNPPIHLTGYRLVSRASSARTVRVTNQFGQAQVLRTGNATRLLAPSGKRHCAEFEAKTNLPIQSDATEQQVATITKITLTPYRYALRGACPPT